MIADQVPGRGSAHFYVIFYEKMFDKIKKYKMNFVEKTPNYYLVTQNSILVDYQLIHCIKVELMIADQVPGLGSVHCDVIFYGNIR